ncbi:MAG TPA: DNA-processing protein DprA [Rubricoccaceae bacterium]|nr:DNA-processing protein DprA [Rubricoccaceae bacterium]
MSLFSPEPPAADPADPEEQRALVALSLVPGVGPGRLRALLARFGTAAAVRRASPRQLAATDGVGRQTAEAVSAFRDEAEVERQFRRAAEVGAHLVTLHDPRYPALLKRIYDPPPLLWVRGRLTEEDEAAVAVVGTRKATAYGKRAAEHFADGLARRGLTVVSGLAYGIDAAAHRAALEAGGRTVAVLGSGVDRIYPSRHAGLVRQILEADAGAVVSEFPLGAEPDAGNFPRRNRIIAGLALGTLVVEMRDTGGALITAMMALEQNREVWAVPAPLFSEMEGTNRLIRRSYAALVTGVEDVLADLEGVLDPVPPAAASPEVAPAEGLNRIEAQLYDALGPEPVHLDALCAATGLDAPTALVYLLNLEFRGLVRQLAGKQFFRA